MKVKSDYKLFTRFESSFKKEIVVGSDKNCKGVYVKKIYYGFGCDKERNCD